MHTSLGVQPGGDDGCRVIAAAASQGGGHTGFVCADIPGDYGQDPQLEQRQQALLQPLAGQLQQGMRRPKAAIGDDQAGCVDRLGANAALAQHRSQDAGGELLAEGRHGVVAAAGHLAQDGDAAVQPLQLVQTVFDIPADLQPLGAAGEQALNDFQMARQQARLDLPVDAILPAGRSRGRRR